jgi:transposase
MGMKSTRAKHTAAFKAKVALEALREQQSVAEIARRHGLHANQVYKWKREFVEGAAAVFDRDADTAQSGSSEREDQLLKKIGELTVERDFLSRGLGRLR